MSINKKQSILIQNIKDSNCLKSQLNAGNMMYSIVSKRLSFIVPIVDPQNIAFKTFCYHADLLLDAESFEEGILNYRENIINKTLDSIEITELTENFYIIVKIVINPFVKAIQNYFSQKSHNLTFREYVKSFKDESIKEIMNKSDFLVGDLQYVLDEEFLITGTIKVPEDPKMIIKHEEELTHNVTIDVTQFFENKDELSNFKFMADIPLDEIDPKRIDMFKTEYFYDQEIKKKVLDHYLIDFSKYKFSSLTNVYNPFNEDENNYDESYLQQMKDKFGEDAEYVLKEEQRNNNSINQLKLEQQILNGQINTFKQQINYKKKIQEQILNEKNKFNKSISKLQDEIKLHTNKIEKFKIEEPKLWNKCDEVIQKRLKEETLLQENQKDFDIVEKKYLEFVLDETSSKEIIDKLQETINTFINSKNELENYQKSVKNTITQTNQQLKESTEELLSVEKEVYELTEQVHIRSEVIRNTGIEYDKTSSLVSNLNIQEKELELQKKQLLDSLEAVEKNIMKTQNESKKMSTLLSNLSNNITNETPLLKEDSSKLESLIKEKDEKTKDITSEENTISNANIKITEIESEKSKIEMKLKTLNEKKGMEILNKRKKTIKKEDFEKDYTLKKKINENHKKKFDAIKSVEEFQVNRTKNASLEKIESEKKIKELNKKINSSTDTSNKLSQSENKIEIQLIENATSIEKCEKEISDKEIEINHIMTKHDSISQQVQYYRQQLIKQVHTHSVKDKHSIANNLSVNKILIEVVERRNLDNIIDIGAKTGEFSKLFLNCSCVKNIDLIEPNYGMYSLLKAYSSENNKNEKLPHINIHNIGIMSDQIKSLLYYYSGLENSIGSFKKEKILGNPDSIRTKYIPSKKLDDLIFKGDKLLLKIDCGNKNIQVIQTMSKLLESKKVEVMCIIAKDKTDPYNDFMINFVKMYFKKYKSVMMPKFCMIFEDPK